MASERNPEEHDPLDTVLTDRTIGAASKLALYRLWKLYGCQLGVGVIRLDWLGPANGRDARSAKDWLRELERHGLVSVDQHNKRRGTIRVWLLSLHPGDQERKPDPQLRLPFTVGPGVASEQAEKARGGFCAETPAQPGVLAVQPGVLAVQPGVYVNPGAERGFLHENPRAATPDASGTCDNPHVGTGIAFTRGRAHDHDDDDKYKFVVVMNSLSPNLGVLQRRAKEIVAAVWPCRRTVDERCFYLLVRAAALVEYVWPDRRLAEEWLANAIAATVRKKAEVGYLRRCLQFGCFDVLGLCASRSESEELFSRAMLAAADVVRPLMDNYRAEQRSAPKKPPLEEHLAEIRRQSAEEPMEPLGSATERWREFWAAGEKAGAES